MYVHANQCHGAIRGTCTCTCTHIIHTCTMYYHCRVIIELCTSKLANQKNVGVASRPSPATTFIRNTKLTKPQLIEICLPLPYPLLSLSFSASQNRPDQQNETWLSAAPNQPSDHWRKRKMVAHWMTHHPLNWSSLDVNQASRVRCERERECVCVCVCVCVHTCSFIYNGHYYSRYDSMHVQMCMHTLQLQESRSINSQPCKVSAGRGAERRWRESVMTVRSCWYCQHCETEHLASNSQVSTYTE